MKKRIWIVAIVIICIAIIMTMTVLSGCVNHLEDEVIIGDFVCQVRHSINTINLKNLSEEGKKKKYIVVPQELDGKKVMMLGYNDAIFSTGRSHWESENLEKIFICSDYVFLKHGLLEDCPNAKKCLLINNNYEYTTHFVGVVQYYVSSYVYYTKWGGDDNLPIKLSIESVANISYYYNYEGSPNNGYYWIDDVEDGEKIEYIPENPTREGYKFEGWYKETECINKWDFEEDTVVKAQIHLEGVEKYIENKLFAKWAKE